MTSRRLFLLGLLSVPMAMSIDAAHAGEKATPFDRQAIPDETAFALDEAEIAFSQRPQLHYNRQRQTPPRAHKRRRNTRRWHHRRIQR